MNSDFGNSKDRKIGIEIETFIDDYTVIDTETSNGDICQLAALKIRNGKIVNKYKTLVNCIKPLSTFILNNTKITEDKIKNAPLGCEVIRDYIAFIGDDVVVGQNLKASDLYPVYDLYYETTGQEFSNDYIDTYHIANKSNLPIQRHGLNDLREHFGLIGDAHDALSDCEDTYKVYEILKFIPLKNIEKPMQKKNGYQFHYKDLSYKDVPIEELGDIVETEASNWVIKLTECSFDCELSRKARKCGFKLENELESVRKKDMTFLVKNNETTNTNSVKNAIKWGKEIYTFDEFKKMINDIYYKHFDEDGHLLKK